MPALCHSPRVTGALRADFSSLESVLKSPHFAGKQGEQLALAIYDYFTSEADGTYHYWPADETEGQPRIRRNVSDPLKYLNVYGWMICGQCSRLLYGLYQAAGFPTRQFGLPGHSLCEVFYEGRWHILDVDMRTWFRTPQGHIASAYELASNPKALILENANRSNPCSLPDRPAEVHAAMYSQVQRVPHEENVAGIWPHWAVRGWTMDFRLRPGETLIRSQVPKARFHLPKSWVEAKKKETAEKWQGHPRERYAPFRSYGNGRWIYAPDLAAGSADFEQAVWEKKGLTQDASGVRGAGQADIRIQSPYVFCGVPDASGPEIKHTDGVWLEAAGTGPASFAVTNAEGQWVEVYAAQGAFARRIDVTQLLSGRYECLVRFALAAQAVLSKFKFDACILTAPASLPQLVEGGNAMKLCYLDKHHQYTVPWTQFIDFRSQADIPAQAVRVENGISLPYVKGWQMFDLKDVSRPVRASFRFSAPAARRFAWFYALATVREGPPGERPRSALLEWSLDGEAWAPCAGLRVPSTPLQWDSSLDAEILLPELAETVWLRVTSETALCGLEFYGHLNEGVVTHEPLEVTHRWTEGGAERSFQAPAGALEYVVECGKEPAGHTIEMHAPSRGRTP